MRFSPIVARQSAMRAASPASNGIVSNPSRLTDSGASHGPTRDSEHGIRFSLARIELVHGIAIVETSVLHHHADRIRVADVLERIGIEDDEIGELASLDRSEVHAKPDRVGAKDRCGAQSVHVRHSATCGRPKLPVIAESLELAVTPDPYPATRLDDVIRALGVLVENVLLLHVPAAVIPAAELSAHP